MSLQGQESCNMSRKRPNIVITGTPGVGKTSHCERLAQNSGLEHMSINRIVKERNCHDGWDEDYKSWIVNEDDVHSTSAIFLSWSKEANTISHKLLDSIETELKTGGYIIDWHACDLFPKSWIDLVVVLRTESVQLYDRLKARSYPEKKLQENMDSEIMEVLLEEARSSYDEEIVVDLQSNEAGDIDANVERIEEWITNWKKSIT